MNTSDRLTEGMHRALEALAQYRYLTITQMISAGVSPSYSHISRSIVRPLLCGKYPLIGFHDFGVIAGVGRLHKVYYLTENGARLLSEYSQLDFDAIRYPVRGVQYSRDYFHRLAYVDICIAFTRHMQKNDLPILRMLHYFDKTGKPRKGTALTPETSLAITRGFIAPDGLFLFEAQGKRRAVAVEFHHIPRTTYIVEQLERHVLAMEQSTVSRYLGHDKRSFVFSIFSDENASERVRTTLLKNERFVALLPSFHFNTLDHLKNGGFADGWILADGSKCGLFG